MKPLRIVSICISLAVTGCAGTNMTPGPSVANPAAQSVASGAINRDAPARRVKADKASFQRALYIADQTNNNIKILTNTYYRELGEITSGIDQPVDLTLDQLGRLYVANAGSGSVTEYAPGATSPSFTYNANMVSSIAVAVDRHGNVYEADNGSNPGVINEYYQGSNVVSQSCVLPFNDGEPLGLFVDASGDVFFSVNAYFIYEYAGGLAGCSWTVPSGYSFGDGVLDSNSNLIASQNQYGADQVAVLAPPYQSISRTIGSGFSHPAGLSINKKNKLVFVADPVNDNVTVINYSTGQNVKVLSGASFGIKSVSAVVDGPNDVP